MFGFSYEGAAVANKQLYGTVQSRMATAINPDISSSLILLYTVAILVTVSATSLDGHYLPYSSVMHAHETTMIIVPLITCSFVQCHEF